MKTSGLLLLVAALIMPLTTVLAEVPQMINYQGNLTDDQGEPLDTTISIVFTIYDDSTGGGSKWTETHPAVSVESGGFSVILGATDPIDDSVFASDERWLGVIIGADLEITPRTRLTSVPYTYHASTVAGFSPGPDNINSGLNTFVAGDSNTVLSDYSTIAGGLRNRVEVINLGDTAFDTSGIGDFSAGSSAYPSLVQDNGAILGGYNNTVNGYASAVVHGEFNQAIGAYSFIGGGLRNISGDPSLFSQGSTVGGGWYNTATGFCSATGGGLGNTAINFLSAIGGGGNNHVDGQFATVPGGWANNADADYSLACGRQAKVLSGHDGTFVWADHTMADFVSTDVDQFLIRANGGVGIGTNSPNPASQLDVNGLVHMTGFQMPSGAVNGRVLTCNASGVGTWQSGTGGGNTLDEAYDEGGAGAGRTINADAGYVDIDGPDGLHVEGNFAIGSLTAPDNDILLYGRKTLSSTTWKRGLQLNIYNTSSGQLNGIDCLAQATTPGSGGVVFGARAYGISDGTSLGVQGIAHTTTQHSSSGTTYGVFGSAQYGQDAFGIFGQASGATTNWAGFFSGNVNVTGILSKASGMFKIDHPLDPEHKYLQHSFVESPDMMNVYNGNVTLDANGEATIELPDYFDALNKDFRYQLTCIGGFAPIYVAEEIADNQFMIAGGESGMKVSWQVTGVRKDAFAEANRIQVEVDKPNDERGKYAHPEAFGLSKEMGTEYEQHQLIQNQSN
ncbi:MAG: hypothetical protein GY841_14210 [FCB group bacterium]|nr:hypothetical protein [FCB group bacterium]